VEQGSDHSMIFALPSGWASLSLVLEPDTIKATMKPYCDYCNAHPEDTYNWEYHNPQYGFPLHADNGLFGRLILEINQAGLSWITILKKMENFRRAYHGFDVARVAKYGEEDRARLLADPGIIRNRLKVNAAIVNAQRILALQKECGSFKDWLELHHPLTKEEWTGLFKKT
jgi:DNA-3-methyladenine glycosylase I